MSNNTISLDGLLSNSPTSTSSSPSEPSQRSLSRQPKSFSTEAVVEPTTPKVVSAPTSTGLGLSSKSSLESDPARFAVDLPSLFHFYDFKSLSSGNVSGVHQAKFFRAAKESRTRHLVDAISTLLDPGVSAWDLSIQDFNWLLYWLRLNCFTKVPLMHQGVCTNKEHLRKVASKELPEQSLLSIHHINNTKLKETVFDSGVLDVFLANTDFNFLDNSPYKLHVACIADLVALEEDFLSMPNFAEIEYLADFASLLSNKEGTRSSLRTRIEFVEQLTPDALNSLSEYRDLVSTYGVVESVKFVCPECRAETETAVSISAHSFL
jgi:hypothetical protein